MLNSDKNNFRINDVCVSQTASQGIDWQSCKWAWTEISDHGDWVKQLGPTGTFAATERYPWNITFSPSPFCCSHNTLSQSCGVSCSSGAAFQLKMLYNDQEREKETLPGWKSAEILQGYQAYTYVHAFHQYALTVVHTVLWTNPPLAEFMSTICWFLSFISSALIRFTRIGQLLMERLMKISEGI